MGAQLWDYMCTGFICMRHRSAVQTTTPFAYLVLVFLVYWRLPYDRSFYIHRPTQQHYPSLKHDANPIPALVVPELQWTFRWPPLVSPSTNTPRLAHWCFLACLRARFQASSSVLEEPRRTFVRPSRFFPFGGKPTLVPTSIIMCLNTHFLVPASGFRKPLHISERLFRNRANVAKACLQSNVSGCSGPNVTCVFRISSSIAPLSGFPSLRYVQASPSRVASVSECSAPRKFVVEIQLQRLLTNPNKIVAMQNRAYSTECTDALTLKGSFLRI